MCIWYEYIWCIFCYKQQLLVFKKWWWIFNTYFLFNGYNKDFKDRKILFSKFFRISINRLLYNENFSCEIDRKPTTYNFSCHTFFCYFHVYILWILIVIEKSEAATETIFENICSFVQEHFSMCSRWLLSKNTCFFCCCKKPSKGPSNESFLDSSTKPFLIKFLLLVFFHKETFDFQFVLA